ncbi:hypothetical protein [Methylocystis sp. S23]|jgi:hypothetical protein
MFTLRNVLLCALAAAGLVCGAALASAHGAMRRVENACILNVGPDFMYFSGYQPAVSHKKFCEDAPTTGDTIFSLDYAQPEMREMTAELRIVRGDGAEEPDNLQAVTVAYLPPRIYPNGTISFEHVFAERGDYVGIVTVDGPHGEHWVSRFPFSVGRLYSPRTPYYLIAAAAAFALLILLWGKDAPPKRPE